MPRRNDLETLLIIGSGPIVIGQACEFDYSGNQAVRTLKEEGYRVILLNPNPATFMTTPGLADAIYMDPLTPDYVEQIIARERPQGVLATMGGQTALNLIIELDEAGILTRYGVEALGASVASIRLAEDRGAFKQLMHSIGFECPHSEVISTLEAGWRFADANGFPIIIRPSYTLGGRGGGIAYNADTFEPLLRRALAESPATTALVEVSLIGWQEFELEVMCDSRDNAIIVCSMENIDPMGIHTGDSITVAPIQTLSDREYQRMRSMAIQILRAVGVNCGGSNVQFAYNPDAQRLLVIEMNPRVSRSSALASKATGFPIARCAARLAVGYTLDEIVNDITRRSSSCFEPALDYCAVKVPRFELEKFPHSYASLGTQMKSVGESLSIGRTFIEALNRAIRAAEFGFDGLEPLEGEEEQLSTMLTSLHPRRLFAACGLLRKWQGQTQGELHRQALRRLATISGYSPWMLQQLLDYIRFEERLRRAPILDKELLIEAKRLGISDHRIGLLHATDAETVRRLRDRYAIHAAYHLVDTCAAEFEAYTPYFYASFGEIDEGTALGAQAVVILGSGPNRIGQGLEFDTCCTLSSLAYRRLGRKTIMINSNPETVSTDFNVSDRLYIEPLTAEDVGEVLRKEGTRDVVVQLGGQTALNMAAALETHSGAHIVGTPTDRIHAAENRARFAEVIERLGLKQPPNRIAISRATALSAATEIGYPLLVRPSFVLGGRSMAVISGEAELQAYLRRNLDLSADAPLLIDSFIDDAFEYDLDAIADGNSIYIGGIMEHIEAAGVHSGDSACVFPAYKYQPNTLTLMKRAAAAIAREFGIRGFLNIQFAVKDGVVYVLEVNPRASRTVPFISKASGVDLVECAVRVWQGENLRAQGLIEGEWGEGSSIMGWAVKEAVFSFDRFQDVDPLLGPEMRSTGESVGFGDSFGEAFAKATTAAGIALPTTGRLFVAVNRSDRPTILPTVRRLAELGFSVCATQEVADFLGAHGIAVEIVTKRGHTGAAEQIEAGTIDLVINTPLPLDPNNQRTDASIRIAALRHRVAYTTTTSAAEAALAAIEFLRRGQVHPVALRSH